MDWTEDNIARLRALWADGHSTAEIGRRMNISKNAVVGKAHRLELASRGSPIRRSVGSTRGKLKPSKAVAFTIIDPTPAAPNVVTIQPMPEPAKTARSAASRAPGVRCMPCCWPIGEPGRPNFRFCDEVGMAGKPYCEAHSQLAYVKVRDRREDAA